MFGTKIGITLLFIVIIVIGMVQAGGFQKDDSLDSWEAPESISKNYPYILSGYDKMRRPIWVYEMGKWDYRKMVSMGGDEFIQFEKYVDQFTHRLATTNEDPDSGYFLISDMKGFNFWQLTHASTMSFILRKARDQVPALRILKAGWMVNANPATRALLVLMRPVLGDIMRRVEVHGTNRQVFSASIAKAGIPPDQIPPAYGGDENYVAAKVYG